jgi:hypothetical protein
MKRIKSLLVAKEETALNVFKLKAMARGKESLAILMYGSPDPDAVASAMALQEILRQMAGINKCTLISTEPVARQQNREFIRAMKLDIQLLNKTDLSQYGLIALVDAQPTFFGQTLANIHIQPQIVLDHHPCTTVWHAELADIRPAYGSLSTMMTEYLLAAKVRISRKLYTALSYGIKTDTNNFERDSSLEDISAYYLAYSRANRELIRRIELNQIWGRSKAQIPAFRWPTFSCVWWRFTMWSSPALSKTGSSSFSGETATVRIAAPLPSRPLAAMAPPAVTKAPRGLNFPWKPSENPCTMIFPRKPSISFWSSASTGSAKC